MQTTYIEPDLTLDYLDGLDRFGRIVDHAWTNGNGDNILRIQHGYDLSGNRMFRNDIVNPANSEVYSYDSMGQIKLLQRDNFSESWTFDATGNWVQYDKNGIVENRSHNKANEILTGIIHDANGSMTQMPSPKDGQALNCVYDAWNRLVKINGNICYEYDGLNHRIAKTVDGVKTLSFFNSDWQELESRCNDVTTTYLWGLRYIDDLIYRERNEKRLYSLADPNWNVVAICNEDGFVEEHLNYDAFGKVNGLNSDWNRTFTGQVLDHETGLMLYRNRFYHTGLGRFTSRDPILYRANDLNLHRYVANASVITVDSYGLVFRIPWPIDLPSWPRIPRLPRLPKLPRLPRIPLPRISDPTKDKVNEELGLIKTALSAPCEIINDKCTSLALKCASDAVGLLDTANIPIADLGFTSLDCFFDFLTVAQKFCSEKDMKVKNDTAAVFLAASTDCGLGILMAIADSASVAWPIKVAVDAVGEAMMAAALYGQDGDIPGRACKDYQCECR